MPTDIYNPISPGAADNYWDSGQHGYGRHPTAEKSSVYASSPPRDIGGPLRQAPKLPPKPPQYQNLPPVGQWSFADLPPHVTANEHYYGSSGPHPSAYPQGVQGRMNPSLPQHVTTQFQPPYAAPPKRTISAPLPTCGMSPPVYQSHRRSLPIPVSPHVVTNDHRYEAGVSFRQKENTPRSPIGSSLDGELPALPDQRPPTARNVGLASRLWLHDKAVYSDDGKLLMDRRNGKRTVNPERQDAWNQLHWLDQKEARKVLATPREKIGRKLLKAGDYAKAFAVGVAKFVSEGFKGSGHYNGQGYDELDARESAAREARYEAAYRARNPRDY